jgi:hypothetical protein
MHNSVTSIGRRLIRLFTWCSLGIGLNLFSPVVAGQVVINEIMFHPASGDSSEEFIELLNRGPDGVNLNGWELGGGVNYTFPETMLPANTYLVVAADVARFQAIYPEVSLLVGGWDGQLSNRREEIRLTNAQDDLIDQVAYADQGDWAVRRRIMENVEDRGWHWHSAADGLGKSLELVHPGLNNESGQNWAFSAADGGSPGSENSSLKENVAPLITETAHFPVIPNSSNQVHVTARIGDESPSTVTARLHYRTDADPPNPFASVKLLDDGMHQDAQPDDGRFGAVIPPQADGTIVEFYLEATDEQGNRRTWPAPAELEDGTMAQAANPFYQVVDDLDSGPRPLYRLILKTAELPDLRHGGIVQNATFISLDGTGMKSRYLVSVRIRGHGSYYRLPKSFRVSFPRDHPWNGVVDLNLNSQYSFLQVLGSAVCQMAGLHAADSSAVRLLLNDEDFSHTGFHQGLAFGRYAANEVLNSDYADRHFPGDGGGNVYRGIKDQAPANFGYRGEDPEAYQNSYFKRSNSSEDDWSDLIEMTRQEERVDKLGEENAGCMGRENWRGAIPTVETSSAA